MSIKLFVLSLSALALTVAAGLYQALQFFTTADVLKAAGIAALVGVFVLIAVKLERGGSRATHSGAGSSGGWGWFGDGGDGGGWGGGDGGGCGSS